MRRQHNPNRVDTSSAVRRVAGKRYGVILADPPWQYGQRGANSPRFRGTTDRHYATMPTDAIAALPVGEYAADDSILLLWATWPFLADALRVIEAWGFHFTTGLPWVKATHLVCDADGVGFTPRKGVGYWFRGCTEPLLMAKRGSPVRYTVPFDGILADRTRHSEKPVEIYDMAESWDGPYLELFARDEREGWDSVGDQLPDPRDVRHVIR